MWSYNIDRYVMWRINKIPIIAEFVCLFSVIIISIIVVLQTLLHYEDLKRLTLYINIYEVSLDVFSVDKIFGKILESHFHEA